MRFEAPEKRKIILMLPVRSSGSIEDGDDQGVAVLLANLRKGTVDCVTSRAPLDAKLHQRYEDDEALLLSSTAGSEVV
jgi:hypothetical protein